jgi:hypothetical protein
MIPVWLYANVNIIGKKPSSTKVSDMYRVVHPKLSLTKDKSLVDHNEHTANYLFNAPVKPTTPMTFKYDAETGPVDDGLMKWIQQNMLYKNITLDGKEYYVRSCDLARTCVPPVGFQISNMIGVDMFYCNKFPYEKHIAVFKKTESEKKHNLATILSKMYELEFAIHFSYLAMLLRIAISDVSGDHFFEVIKFIDTSYIKNIQARLKSNTMTFNSIISPMLARIIEALNKGYDVVSQYFTDYRTLDIKLPLQPAMRLMDEYTSIVITEARKTTSMEPEKGTEVKDIKDIYDPQLIKFIDYITKLGENISTLSGDDKTKIQKLKKIFELFLLILNGLDNLNTTEIDMKTLDVSQEIYTFLKMCGKMD